MKKILLLIIIIAIVAGAIKLFQTRSTQKANQTKPIERYYAVDTLKAEEKTLQEQRSFLAELKPVQSVAISTKFTGIITHLHVSENSIVKKGDTLVDIDNAELLSNIKALQAQKKAQLADLKYTKTLLQRNEKLYKAGGLSREKYDASLVMYQNKTALLEATTQKIKQLHIQNTYLSIKAPFSGVITTVLLREGDIAVPAKAIVKLASHTQKMIFSYMPTSKTIQVSQDVTYLTQKIGHISKLYNYSENALFLAEVALDKALLLPEHSLVSIKVITKTQEGCSVPLHSLLHNDGNIFVVEYKDEIFTPLHVDILLQNHQEALISPCPNSPVASASEAKLSLLSSLGKVKVSR